MADINDILSNLNSRHEEITNLVPDMRVFMDDLVYAKNEYGDVFNDEPLGSQIIKLSSGKYVWVGIDGADSVARNVRRYNSDFSLDETFTPPTFDTGTNGYVRGVVELSNGKLVIVGHFYNVNGVSRNKIARLNADGSLDEGFDPGLGFNNNALVVRLLSDGGFLVGGSLGNYDGSSVGKIVKFDSAGVLDATFTPDASVDNNVYAIKVDSSGKIYVGGDFTNKLVRLNGNGTLDTAFDVGSGFNSRVSAIALDAAGKVVVGGWFNEYKGSACNRGIVRLEANGDLDAGFTTEGSGLNYTQGVVQCLAVQANNKVVAGGWFDEYNGSRRGHIVRLNSDGTEDTSFEVGYGFNSDGDWEGGRVQHILLDGSSVLCTGSMHHYKGTPVYGFAKLNSSGVVGSERLFRYNHAVGISDGYDDMYDGGNFINTNLTQSFADVSGDDADLGLCVPYTHSPIMDEQDLEDAIGADSINYSPLMDGVVVDGSDYFGEGSQYFTNMYPGMFVMMATGVDIEEFSVTGDLGSDDSTQNESSILVVHEGSPYTVFLKVNREDEGGGDPSVNHLIIVPGEPEGLTQLINEDGDEYDDHCVQGLSGRGTVAFLIVARSNGEYLSDSDAEAVALKFLEVSGGMSSTQTYEYDFSPQTVRPGYGEGGMDTAVVVEDGVRRSLQRTGYFELVNSEGGRKIVSVNDGETVTDEVEVPVLAPNPTGHPGVNSTTGSTI